jgi:hypothetical protein
MIARPRGHGWASASAPPLVGAPRRHDRAHRAGGASLDDARELIGDRVDTTSLYEDSGNPFTSSTARSANRSDLTAARRACARRVDGPPAGAAALPEELALLSTPARRILDGAAVAGDPFDPELAAAAAGAADAAAIDALDELLRLDLVRETDVPRRFRFRHPLIRRTVYESMPGGWRLGSHECAEALAFRFTDIGDRAPRRTLSASGR